MTKEEKLAYNRAYYADNRAAISAQKKDYRAANCEKLRDYNRCYSKANRPLFKSYNKKYRTKHRERLAVERLSRYAGEREKKRLYYATNRDRICAKQRLRSKKIRALKDPIFRLRNTLASRLRNAIRGFCKSARTMVLIGCSVEFLREHLEKQFVPGMTWDNYGKVWHVDHILPCSKFHLQHSEEQEICFNWSNLQPLFVKDNLSKSDKIL